MRKFFAIIDDPRHSSHSSYIKYNLADILIMVMCAVICGMTELCQIVTFAQNKAEFFKKYFNIETIPSFGRLVARQT